MQHYKEFDVGIAMYTIILIPGENKVKTNRMPSC